MGFLNPLVGFNGGLAAFPPFGGFAPFLSNQKNMLVSNREKYPKIPTSAYGKKIPNGYENVMRTIDYKDVLTRCLDILESSKHHQNQ